MRIRHVIVEGPDGAGKTTLVDSLVQAGYARGNKASTSKGGPVDNLAEWGETEEAIMTASKVSMVYDRHPVISEPIYGRTIRDASAAGYDNWQWLIKRRMFLYDHTMVVWCVPPLP